MMQEQERERKMENEGKRKRLRRCGESEAIDVPGQTPSSETMLDLGEDV